MKAFLKVLCVIVDLIIVYDFGSEIYNKFKSHKKPNPETINEGGGDMG